MAPELALPSLADQPWFAEFLESRGFRKSAPSTFSNGRASVRVDGVTLYAVPGDDGKKVWRTQIKETPPEAIRQLLSVVLSAPSFLSQGELDQRSARQRQAVDALCDIANTIRENPDSPAGQQLRRFVWSIYNQHHGVNLWRMKEELSPQQKGWVVVVMTTWAEGYVSEDAIRSALTASGEMDRWETVRLRASEERRLVDAIDAVSDLLNSVNPGKPIPSLVRADGLNRRVLDSLQNARNA